MSEKYSTDNGKISVLSAHREPLIPVIESGIKLKPCPFCGEIPGIRLLDLSPINSWKVHCTSCGGEAGFYTVKRIAIRAWNRRAK